VVAGNEITRAGCWAHARRKIVEAEKTAPEIAREAIEMIRSLYAVEKQATALSAPERLDRSNDQILRETNGLDVRWWDEGLSLLAGQKLCATFGTRGQVNGPRPDVPQPALVAKSRPTPWPRATASRRAVTSTKQ
jgi:hypothetical protein